MKSLKNRFSLIHIGKPASYNQRPNHREAYKNAIKSNFQRNYKGQFPNSDLYGTVIYFFKDDCNLDTDNLSKPVWDALSNVAYTDDKQLKIRSAISFDLSENDFYMLDINGLEGDIYYNLINGILGNDHIVFIEGGIIECLKNIFNINQLWK